MRLYLTAETASPTLLLSKTIPMPKVSTPKIAVVHDWFNCIAGSEKVVKEIMH